MRRAKKSTAVLLVLVLMTCIVYSARNGIEIKAGTVVPSGISEYYKKGSYYSKLSSAVYKSVNDTQPNRLVEIALSQTGYKAGTNKTDIAGDGSGKGKYCEYSEWISSQYPKNGNKRGLDWCASFVSWCAYMAGIPSSIIPHSAGAGTYKRCGTQHKIWSDDFKSYIDYQPKKGDLLLVMPNDKNGKKYNSYDLTAHVAIVTEDGRDYNDKKGWSFTVVERGTGNTVKTASRYSKMSVNGAHYIQMFVTPNYQIPDRWAPTDGNISIYSSDYKVGNEVQITPEANNVESFNLTVRDGTDTSKVLFSKYDFIGTVSFYPEYNGKYEVWMDAQSSSKGFLGLKNSFTVSDNGSSEEIVSEPSVKTIQGIIDDLYNNGNTPFKKGTKEPGGYYSTLNGKSNGTRKVTVKQNGKIRTYWNSSYSTKCLSFGKRAFDEIWYNYSDQAVQVKCNEKTIEGKIQWMKNNVEVGDYIRYGGHSAIVYEKTDTYLKLYDNNHGGDVKTYLWTQYWDCGKSKSNTSDCVRHQLSKSKENTVLYVRSTASPYYK